MILDDLKESIGERKVNNMIVKLDKKLHFTIWMLANHAISYRNATDLFGFSKGTGHLVFVETCRAISSLKDKYISWPTVVEKNRNSETIENTFRFPGVIGSVDGCHIPIRAPINNPIDYYNRKSFHSVILQAACNNNLEFIHIYVGMPGRVHDARVFRTSPLHNLINNNGIPQHQHLLGDSAYQLHVNLMTPFRDNGHLTPAEILYNQRHSAVRSSIERAFALLKGKFRRLKYLDMALQEDIAIVVSACCVLHNVMIRHQANDDEDYANINRNEENDIVGEPENNDRVHREQNNIAVQKRNNIALNL